MQLVLLLLEKHRNVSSRCWQRRGQMLVSQRAEAIEIAHFCMHAPCSGCAARGWNLVTSLVQRVHIALSRYLRVPKAVGSRPRSGLGVVNAGRDTSRCTWIQSCCDVPALASTCCSRRRMQSALSLSLHVDAALSQLCAAQADRSHTQRCAPSSRTFASLLVASWMVY